MRRTVILSVVTALVFALGACSQASAGMIPRGVLSAAEYQEFLSTEQAETQPGHGAITQVAQHECSGLTNISRVTSTEHAECEAALVFFYRFFEFTNGFTGCTKHASKLAVRRCLQPTTSALSWSTQRLLTTDSASERAVVQRGFGGRCLAYLILTPPQRSATRKLAAGLQSLHRALATGNPNALARAGERLTPDLTVAGNVLLVSGTVKVCRHE